ncbi:CatB-related O-acetyltransferase [Pseudomonas cremoricolorata]|uniref:Transferase n=1 Tax=Pseudomonas cremoricolorata TaxID=157783 RepID=A0A089YDK1_9PSED|nr:CatB-related O-acetyltransferase [Pseudomonas cremoricolorata]AIR89848.1 transferase [Pseudomonas cremoricolorata]
MIKLLQPFKQYRYQRTVRAHGGKLAAGPTAFQGRASATIEAFVELGHVRIRAEHLTIGAHTYIRSRCRLDVVSSIGRFCSIGSDCVIGQEKHTHPIDWVSTHPFQYEGAQAQAYRPEEVPCTIGHDVWIGEGATILAGVNVATGAIVATRAMVTKDVPPYAIVAGNPARVIRFRHSPELIERLLASEWWTLRSTLLTTLDGARPEQFLETLKAQPLSPKATYRVLRLDRYKVDVQ